MERFRKFAKVIIFIAIFALIYVKVEHVLEERTGYERYDAFFKAPSDYDVLFFGNSRILNGIYPMELYNDHGIASFNMGGHANRMPTTVWLARNILDHTTPKLIVMDLNSVSTMLKHSEDVRYVHMSFDALPLSRNKIAAVKDLMEKEDQAEFIWKMWIYHNRWSELDEFDFHQVKKLEKGAEMRVGLTAKDEGRLDYDHDVLMGDDTLGEKYLADFLKECDAKGIEVMFTYMPLNVNEEDAPEVNSLEALAAKYGRKYLYMNDAEQVNFDTDFYDSNYHLNPSGARKATELMGEFLDENYDLPDRRGDAAYSSWDRDYEEYVYMKEDYLRTEDDVTKFLPLLYDKNYESEVILYDESFLDDERHVTLLKNAGVYETMERGTGDGIMSVTVTRKSDGSTVCQRDF